MEGRASSPARRSAAPQLSLHNLKSYGQWQVALARPDEDVRVYACS
jgi:hypothetical protein